MPIDPLTRGKIRGGRDDSRPTEDDAARRREGEQGNPRQGEAAGRGRRQTAEPEADRSRPRGVKLVLAQPHDRRAHRDARERDDEPAGEQH